MAAAAEAAAAAAACVKNWTRWIRGKQSGRSEGIVDEGFREMRHGSQDGGGGTGLLRRTCKRIESRVELRGSGWVYNLADADRPSGGSITE